MVNFEDRGKFVRTLKRKHGIPSGALGIVVVNHKKKNYVIAILNSNLEIVKVLPFYKLGKDIEILEELGTTGLSKIESYQHPQYL